MGFKRYEKWLSCIIIVTIFMTLIASAAVASEDPMSNIIDIESHWGKDTIDQWVKRDLINGYPDGTFRPDASISRAEFMAITNRALGYVDKSVVDFSDVTTGDWFHDDVAKAIGAGYISGYPEGVVKPQQDITRQEVAVALCKALDLAPEKTKSVEEFTDAKDIPDWSIAHIGEIVAKGYMGGYPDNSFGVQRPITRAEVVVVLDRIIEAKAPLEDDTEALKEETEPPIDDTTSYEHPGIPFEYEEGKTAHVSVFSRDVGDEKNTPLFKFADLINRAIRYKNENPQTDVNIKFAIYKIGQRSYVGINPESDSYGFIKGFEHDGEDSELLLYSVVKAAQNQVNVDFVYHIDVTNNAPSNEEYLNSFMDNECIGDSTKTVADYLNFRKVQWGTASFQQMHAKFLTVSHYLSDGGTAITDAVYTSSANADDHREDGRPGSDWVQSGVLVDHHPELKASYDRYFDIIFANADDQSNFHDAVRSEHATKSLNYDDKHFSSYFYPIPVEPQGNYVNVPSTGDRDPMNGNAWDTEFNPIAKYVDMLKDAPSSRYIKVNVYHFKTDNFGRKLYDELQEMYNSTENDKARDFQFVVNTNSYESHFSIRENFAELAKILAFGKPTHTKDITFAFSGYKEYYSITGSTNLKLDGICSKANADLVIKEYTTEHPVYNIFKEIYQYQYK